MSSVLKIAINNNDHVSGDLSAPIVLIEYGDYQCPHCSYAYIIIKKIQKEFGSELAYIFRHFPATEIHFYAMQAAIAAEAAGLQDKYWAMHNTIYENQNKLSTGGLTVFAKKIGLNMVQFKKDIQDEGLELKVEKDFEGGVRSGVNFTPTFFINGARFEGGAEDLYENLHQKRLSL